MPVLDFPRLTEFSKIKNVSRHRIVLTPYHTGHLGFIPDTNVVLNLDVCDGREGAQPGCELVATPFDRPIGSMFRLMCLLEDAPGAVSRLLQVLAGLHLDIVKEDSCVLNAHRHHFIEVICDWSRHEQLTGYDMTQRRESRSSDRYRYRHMRERIPISDIRYLRLYEAIMTYCGDIVVLDKAYGMRLPALHVRPYTHRSLKNTETGVIGRDADKNPQGRRAYLQIPQKHLRKISAHTGFKTTERIPYLVSSQGESRTLRVFFPTKKQRKFMFSVALEHRDKTGAVSACTGVLGKLRFNIVASLLRKQSEERSTWEAVLEAPSGLKPPPKRAAVVPWFAKLLNDQPHAIKSQLDPFEFRVTTPLYPKPLKEQSKRVRKTKHRSSAPDRIAKTKQPSPIDFLNDTIAKASLKDGVADPESPRVEYLRDIRRGIKRGLPRIFLSYPRSARRHAAILKSDSRLTDHFIIEEYQEADFRDIVAQALEMIHRCDYFIAIWHAEIGHGTHYVVSPWMPFEYGAALAAGKPSIVVHSEFLPKDIALRINAGIAHPTYSELTFEKATVPAIAEHCLEHWAEPETKQPPKEEEVLTAAQPTKD